MVKMINGFSLIELMVVIAVIGVLSAMAVPVYSEYMANARIASAMNRVNAMLYQSKINYSTTGSFANLDLFDTEHKDGLFQISSDIPTGSGPGNYTGLVGTYKCPAASYTITIVGADGTDNNIYDFDTSGIGLIFTINLIDYGGTIFNYCNFYVDNFTGNSSYDNLEVPGCSNQNAPDYDSDYFLNTYLLTPTCDID